MSTTISTGGLFILLFVSVFGTLLIVLNWRYPIKTPPNSPVSATQMYQSLLTVNIAVIWFLVGLIVCLVTKIRLLKTLTELRVILNDDEDEATDPLSPDYQSP